MKLSRILPLVVGSAAAGFFANMSPAHALTYNWSYDGLADTLGTFSESGGTITVWEGTVGGVGITSLLPSSSVGGNDNLFPLNGSGVAFQDSSGVSYNLFLSSGSTYALSSNSVKIRDTVGNFTATPSSAVPFDIPGGATIPTVGSLLALGAMRKARRSIASKTRIANPATSAVS